MISPVDQAMTADIEAAIRTVPGVTTLFRAGGVISKAVDVGAQLLGTPQAELPLIRWEHQSAKNARVEAVFGVHADAGATETSRKAHAAITSLCADRGYSPVAIHLTVVHIDDVRGSYSSGTTR